VRLLPSAQGKVAGAGPRSEAGLRGVTPHCQFKCSIAHAGRRLGTSDTGRIHRPRFYARTIGHLTRDYATSPVQSRTEHGVNTNVL
jgi:hypothetical protein